MQILGASQVETLDTRGTDGANVNLGGPETIAGYFGGIGQPNDYPLRWADEYLHYLTEFGIRQVLNVNLGTILVGLLLRKLGVSASSRSRSSWASTTPTRLRCCCCCARLLAGERRLHQSRRPQSLQLGRAGHAAAAAEVREALGLTDAVRFEHHVTEAYRSIVRQPYDRLADVCARRQRAPTSPPSTRAASRP